jgi:hypothetical protein
MERAHASDQILVYVQDGVELTVFFLLALESHKTIQILAPGVAHVLVLINALAAPQLGLEQFAKFRSVTEKLKMIRRFAQLVDPVCHQMCVHVTHFTVDRIVNFLFVWEN